MTSCTLPRNAIVGELGAEPGQRQHWSMDLDRCSVTTIHMAMNEFEKATSPTFDGWPPTIQHRINKELERFKRDHTKRDVRAITQGVFDNTCIMVLHWTERT